MAGFQINRKAGNQKYHDPDTCQRTGAVKLREFIHQPRSYGQPNRNPKRDAKGCKIFVVLHQCFDQICSTNHCEKRAKKHQNQHSTDKTTAKVRRPFNLVHDPSLVCLFVVFPHHDAPCRFLLPRRCNGLCLLQFSLLLFCATSTVFSIDRLESSCRRLQGKKWCYFHGLATLSLGEIRWW